MSGSNSQDNVNTPPTCKLCVTSRLPVTETDVDALLSPPERTSVEDGEYIQVTFDDPLNIFNISDEFSSYNLSPRVPIYETFDCTGVSVGDGAAGVGVGVGVAVGKGVGV